MEFDDLNKAKEALEIKNKAIKKLQLDDDATVADKSAINSIVVASNMITTQVDESLKNFEKVLEKVKATQREVVESMNGYIRQYKFQINKIAASQSEKYEQSLNEMAELTKRNTYNLQKSFESQFKEYKQEMKYQCDNYVKYSNVLEHFAKKSDDTIAQMHFYTICILIGAISIPLVYFLIRYIF